MFLPTSINEFVKSYLKINPSEKDNNIGEVLAATVESKKKGAKCNVCGNPIWAIGSAIVGWDGCFTCITGESDNSEDYEVEDVCF